MASHVARTADMQRTCLITGCSSGIGKSLAREFNSRGFRVFATARNADTISDLAAEGIETLSLEVHKPKSIEELKNEVTKRTGGLLHVLVNNAGRAYTMPALDLDFDEVQHTYEVNVFAVMRMCQAFSPLLIKARGAIVQIGSVAAIVNLPYSSVYNSSKAALHHYSNTLRIEMAPFSVKVITVVTGGVVSSIGRTHRELPPDSVYLPVAADFDRRANYSQEDGMPTNEYAKSVVNKVMKLEPRAFIWEGTHAWKVWVVDTFLTKTWMDRVLIKMWNLWKLAHWRQGDPQKKEQ